MTRTVLVAHPFADRYGSDRMVLESIKGLVDAGWRVVVTLPEGGPLVSMVEACGAAVALCPTVRLSKAMLRPRAWPTLVGQLVRGLRSGWALLRRLRPAVVYVNTVTVPLWVCLARLRRTPVLCHVHEAERSASRLLRTVLAAPLLLADVVVANSRFAVEVVGSSFPRLARRTQVLVNGVEGPPVRERARIRLSGPVRLVYVGRLSPRKGVDMAVDAVAVLRERGISARLDVVGDVFPGYEWYRDRLADRVRELGLEGHVEQLGFQDPVWPHLGGADVVLVPSRSDEPFGNTAVEAILAARPVVASGSGGLVEATAGYRAARTVPPGDPEALAEGVTAVVATWAESREAAWQDAALAEERHAPQRYRAGVAALVDRAAARGVTG